MNEYEMETGRKNEYRRKVSRVVAAPIKSEIEAFHLIWLLRQYCDIGPNWSPMRAHEAGEAGALMAFEDSLCAGFAERRWAEAREILGGSWEGATIAP